MREYNSPSRRRFLGAAATIFGAGQIGSMRAASSLPSEGALPSFRGATGWLNSRPLTASDLRGKVVLADFWTYSCINWRRTLPYLRAWDKRYRDNGLVIVGVHTPEFPFEKDAANIRRAVAEMAIGYPVAIDSDQAIWRAFRNEYWPALYLADAAGRIRYHRFGEGAYEESEVALRTLLADTGAELDRAAATVDAHGVEVEADWANLNSPETYAGYEQAENFVSHGGAVRDQPSSYSIPARLGPNQWAIAGTWTVRLQDAVLHAAKGRIAFRFHARDLHLVMGPSGRQGAVRFRVTLDGQPVGTAHGSDVDQDGSGTVTEPRLYQLVRQHGAIVDRQFEIEFLDAGVAAYSFTFG